MLRSTHNRSPSRDVTGCHFQNHKESETRCPSWCLVVRAVVIIQIKPTCKKRRENSPKHVCNTPNFRKQRNSKKCKSGTLNSSCNSLHSTKWRESRNAQPTNEKLSQIRPPSGTSLCQHAICRVGRHKWLVSYRHPRDYTIPTFCNRLSTILSTT